MNSSDRRAVVLTGGVAHDFPSTTAALVEVLAEAGFVSTVNDDPDAALISLRDIARPSEGPLVVMNMLRWTMQEGRHAHQRAEWSLALSERARQALTRHVHEGGGLLAMHGASICFDDWPGWKDLLGGVWAWGHSSHPRLDHPIRVTVASGTHPIVEGCGDFDIVDEAYGFLSRTDDVVGLLHSPHGGEDHPLLWARQVGSGRVVYDALGHDTRSYDVREHRLIVRRAALWAAGAH